LDVGAFLPPAVPQSGGKSQGVIVPPIMPSDGRRFGGDEGHSGPGLNCGNEAEKLPGVENQKTAMNSGSNR